MKKTKDYIEETKCALNLTSDYSLAAWLGVTRQAISNYKKERTTIDDYAAARIAEALGIDPLEVIAAANMEREKNAKKKEFWEKLSQKITTAVLVVLLIGSTTYINQNFFFNNQHLIHYTQLLFCLLGLWLLWSPINIRRFNGILRTTTSRRFPVA